MRSYRHILGLTCSAAIGLVALFTTQSPTVSARGSLGEAPASAESISVFELIDTDYLSGRISAIRSAYLKASLVRDREALPARYLSESAASESGGEDSSPLGRCANPVMREVSYVESTATGPDRVALRQLLARPVLQRVYDSPGGHFKLHFDTSDSHAVPVGDTNGNSVPDFIERLAEVADSVWRMDVDHLGYLPPPSDDTAGGDDRYDIYFQQLSFYGYIISEAPGADPWNDYASYMFLHRNFLNFPPNTDPEGSQLGSAKATLAHEFFHAIQYAYDRDDEIWFMESSATWSEEIVFDSTNDNYTFLPFYLNWPHTALHVEGDHMYGSFLWPLYFSESYDVSLLRSAWEGARYDDAMVALGDSLFANYGVKSEEAFANYVPWMYLTGHRDVGGRFPEAGAYPAAAVAKTHTEFPVVEQYSARSPGGFASAFIEFQPNGSSGALRISFDGSDSRLWDAKIIARSATDQVTTLTMPLDYQRRGAIIIEDFEDYSTVALAGTNLSIYTTPATFRYAAEFISSEALIVEALTDTVAFTLAQNLVGARVVNFGSGVDSFALSASESAGWDLELIDSNSAPLSPGESAVLRVGVTPPDGTLPGAASLVTLRVTSLANASVQDSVTALQRVVIQRGDADWNGKLAIGDVTHLINYLFLGGAAPAPEIISGDANCSGTIGIGDVTELVNRIFLGGPPPPCNALDPL